MSDDTFLPPPRDQIGPPSGMVNLGTGWEDQIEIDNDHDDSIPIEWIREPEYPDTWTPIYTVRPFGQKMGWPRKEKVIRGPEKRLMVTAFANDVAEWLFSQRMFDEIDTDEGVDFKPNPKFEHDHEY